MSLLFRAIWYDDAPDTVARAHQSFARWVSEKVGIDIPLEGEATSADGHASVLVARGANDVVEVLRCALHEDSGDERWTTTLLAMTGSQDEPSLWVDVERVSHDTFARPPDVGAPRLVRDLLNSGKHPHVGATELRDTPRVWGPKDIEALAKEALDPARGLPLAVFSPDPHSPPAVTMGRATRAAQGLAGVASVEVLTPETVDPFMEMLGGRSFGVWGGAVRVYLPGLDAGDTPYRHFLLTLPVIAGFEAKAAVFLVRRLATYVTAQRAPTGYASARLLMRAPAVVSDDRDVIDALEDAESARRSAREWEDLYLATAADLEELSKEVSRRDRYVSELLRALGGAEAPGTVELPATADCPSEAAAFATEYLTALVIPEGALVDLDDLDTAIESRAWGATSWRAFQALDAYARSNDRLGFWHWCETTSSPHSWPATPKKLAMNESEAVLNNPRLRQSRRLPIDPAVDPSGMTEMFSHLKISEGGGPLAPRIYFYDDTKGSTGKVHVGYFGPHRNMPNKSRN
jgi:hypothetical protein